MALDVGDSRIGVALSDPTEVLASPLTIIRRTNESADVQIIADLVKQHGAGKLVIGLPISLAGGEGMQSEKVKAFTAQLKVSPSVPIELVDERFSTVTAKEYMRESGVKKKRRAEHHDDAIAAAVILQDYLDESRGRRG